MDLLSLKGPKVVRFFDINMILIDIGVLFG